MEIAICTRCQSSNPVFTKFCLTCGLAITADMKRSVAVNAPTVAPTGTKNAVTPAGAVAATGTVATMNKNTATDSQTASTMQNQPAAQTDAQPSQTDNQSNQAQPKNSWLKSLFSK